MINFRKSYLFAFIAIATFYSCEKEDFCDGNATTPTVKIDFYDRANTNNLKAFNKIECYVLNENSPQDTTFIVFTGRSNIELPLNLNANETVWNLRLTQVVNNTTTTATDQLIFNYTRKKEYVSKACGYKTVFTNVITSVNQNGIGTWIINFSPLSNSIINDENPYAKIYY